MNYEKFNEYIKLDTINDLIADPSSTGHVSGTDTAAEALEIVSWIF